jgi:GNAT superfamily N-acetyltransferase
MIAQHTTSGPAYTPNTPAIADVRNLQLTPAAQCQATADVMFYSWWRCDSLIGLQPLASLSVGIAHDHRLIAEIARIGRAAALARVRAGHRPYIAWLDDTPVAYGWSALSRASIGELGLEFGIPAGNRYLWDFATLPDWRGLGIYPRLLQAILARESAEAHRFWIGHVRDNLASKRGIVKAGFGEAGTADRAGGRALRFVASDMAERAQACAALLGLDVQAPGLAARV